MERNAHKACAWVNNCAEHMRAGAQHVRNMCERSARGQHHVEPQRTEHQPANPATSNQHTPATTNQQPRDLYRTDVRLLCACVKYAFDQGFHAPCSPMNTSRNVNLVTDEQPRACACMKRGGSSCAHVHNEPGGRALALRCRCSSVKSVCSSVKQAENWSRSVSPVQWAAMAVFARR